MPDVLKKVTADQLAKPLSPRQLAPPQLAPVKPLSLSREDVENYLANLSQERRAEIIISAILQTKTGRRM